MQTVTGLFDDYADARAAVTEMEQAGVPSENISIIANNVGGRHADESRAVEGAGTGAAVGAVTGGALGLSAGLGLMAIPGIGPVVAAGWLVATLAGAAAGAVSIGAVGGIIGGLIDAGIYEEDAHFYAEGIRRGGTLVIARVLDEPMAYRVQAILGRASVDPAERRAAYEQTGWERFDEAGRPWTDGEIDAERDRLRPRP
ncbi:hypothetical protein [Ensifer sp. B1-9]|uniref:hypothetical protein n=1 Tax=Ensifer sp. B1-9 TaxID=3141455 RepID=UPI003D1CF5D5